VPADGHPWLRIAACRRSHHAAVDQDEVTGVRAALSKEVTVPAVNVGSTRSGFRDSTMMICHSFQSKLLPNAFPDLFDWAVVNALRFMFDQPAPKRFDESSAAVHQRDLVIVDVAVVPRSRSVPRRRGHRRARPVPQGLRPRPIRRAGDREAALRSRVRDGIPQGAAGVEPAHHRLVKENLAALRKRAGPNTELPFITYGTMADPRWLDASLELNDREAGVCYIGDPAAANKGRSASAGF
jgi:hypothetical protein